MVRSSGTTWERLKPHQSSFLPEKDMHGYGTRAAYVILSEDGAVVMNDCYNGRMRDLS